MSFYPPTYEPPSKEKDPNLVSDYMKLDKPGEYKIRILQAPIIGFETWDAPVGKGKPHRARTFQEAVNLPSFDSKIKEFHAFVVWDYQTSMVRWLNITQQTIKEPIYDQTRDEDWADPTKYDIVIKRVGTTKDDTKYSVIFKLPKPMDVEIRQAFLKVTIVPGEYFSGGHPIIRDKDSAADTTRQEEVREALTENEKDIISSVEEKSNDLPF